MADRRLNLAGWVFLVTAMAALSACGSSPKPDAGAPSPSSGLGVNSFLWRASLDTLSFMPLASEDPFGGVIISEWYSPPETPNERFKVNIYILDRQLNAEALRATVFRQVRSPGSDWADSAVDPKTAGDLENQILTRARQMRIAANNMATQQ